jgi:hypothetical protein
MVLKDSEAGGDYIFYTSIKFELIKTCILIFLSYLDFAAIWGVLEYLATDDVGY